MGMADKYAVRNIRLCTKDCLCLYVCPTGATDTENSIIDVENVLAVEIVLKLVHLVQYLWSPFEYPPQQPKKEEVLQAMKMLCVASQNRKILPQDYRAGWQKPEKSNRIMAEDIIREADICFRKVKTQWILQSLMENKELEGLPVDAVKIIGYIKEK